MPQSPFDRTLLILLAASATLLIVPFSLGLDADRSADDQPLESIVACRELDNDIARLQCFDDAVADLDLGDELETERIDSRPEADSAGMAKVAEVGESEDSDSVEAAKNRPRRPTDPASILEADEAMVENCEFLGTVVGKSGWGGMASGAASRGSIRSAKKRAAAKGATHIVVGNFRNARSGMTVSTTQARAYACD